MAARGRRPGLIQLTGLGLTALALTAHGTATASPTRAEDDPPRRERLVDPFIGTDGNTPWFAGHTTPAAALPFGMVQLGPDTTADGETGRPSAYASGYGHRDPLVRGFSPTHLSGAGCRTFGDVPILPFTGRLPADPGGATVPLDHDSERAGPGWYAARLGNGVEVQLAAAERAGLASFRFPHESRATLLVKASGSLAGTDRTRVRVTRRNEVAVTVDSGHFCGQDTSYRVHVVLRFDQEPRRHGVWGHPRRGGSAAAGSPGESTGLWLDFGRRTDRVRAQIGVSFVSRAGARRNLDAADPGWSMRRAKARARTAWRAELDRVALDGGTSEGQRLFYTALYHALLHPTLLSDTDGRYPGFDGQVHRVRGDHRHYTAISGWDVYRTQIPLLAWLRPDVASDVVRSLHRAAEEGGRYPRWPLVAQDTGVMGGDSAAPIVAAAHAFGARDFQARGGHRRAAATGPHLATRPRRPARPRLRADTVRGRAARRLRHPRVRRGRLRPVPAGPGGRRRDPPPTSCTGAAAPGEHCWTPTAECWPRVPPTAASPASASGSPPPGSASRRATPRSTPGRCRTTRPVSSQPWGAERRCSPGSTSSTHGSTPVRALPTPGSATSPPSPPPGPTCGSERPPVPRTS